jgi:hypothetical protein
VSPHTSSYGILAESSKRGVCFKHIRTRLIIAMLYFQPTHVNAVYLMSCRILQITEPSGRILVSEQDTTQNESFPAYFDRS